MNNHIQWTLNRMPKTGDRHLGIMDLHEIEKARTFHESICLLYTSCRRA